MKKFSQLSLGIILFILLILFSFPVSGVSSSVEHSPNTCEQNHIGISRDSIDGSLLPLRFTFNSLSNSVDLIYPDGGETLSGNVTVFWSFINTNLSIEDSVSYSIFYSPDNGQNWIQIAFSILRNSFEWNTALYEPYGSNFILKVTAFAKSIGTVEDISDFPFTIDNRVEGSSNNENGHSSSSTETTSVGQTSSTTEPPIKKGEANNSDLSPYILSTPFIALFGILSYFLYISKFRKPDSFAMLLQSGKVEFLKSIRHKVVIGLDNIKNDVITDPGPLPSLVHSTKVDHTSMVEYFPSDIKNDLRSEMKGRTVLTLIEIAFQEPSETNPIKLSKSLNIPPSTLSKEIKKLVDLQYVENYISTQVLRDARFRNFVITTKGFRFLYLLNEALQLTITRVKEKSSAY
ncbi:MAG: hypothetical protein ACXAC7_07250 [Candidatus Hodarchaeales archaeon]|jgi:DNA-binding MarR family transcriptional regulator